MPGYPILWDWAEYWMSIRKVYAFRFYFESLDVYLQIPTEGKEKFQKFLNSWDVADLPVEYIWEKDPKHKMIIYRLRGALK